MTTSNLFQRLRDLLPLPPVLVGTVMAIHDDDTSTVLIPTGVPLSEYANNVAAGSLIRPRGTTVPVGKKAFVRAGVIETQAPDGVAVPLPIGTIILPPAPPPPAPPPAPSSSMAWVLEPQTTTFATRSVDPVQDAAAYATAVSTYEISGGTYINFFGRTIAYFYTRS